MKALPGGTGEESHGALHRPRDVIWKGIYFCEEAIKLAFKYPPPLSCLPLPFRMGGLGEVPIFLHHCEGAPGPVPGEGVAVQKSQAIWAALVQACP